MTTNQSAAEARRTAADNAALSGTRHGAGPCAGDHAHGNCTGWREEPRAAYLAAVGEEIRQAARPEPGAVRVAITFEEVPTAPHGRVTVGHVDVGQPDECEREADEWTGDDDSSLRAAAVAWEAVTRNGVFTVNGKTYEASECADWWA